MSKFDANALWRRLSVGLFAALSVVFIAFGLLYANVGHMLWFHAAAVPEAARGEVLPLYFALMRLIGGWSIALGLLGGYVALVRLRDAAAALAIAFAIPLITAAYVAETLAARTGAPTSWHIMGALLLIDAAAYGASVFASRNLGAVAGRAKA